MSWFEILVYNAIFWSVWFYISTLPEKIMQKKINNFQKA